jgi:hypothetical protein
MIKLPDMGPTPALTRSGLAAASQEIAIDVAKALRNRQLIARKARLPKRPPEFSPETSLVVRALLRESKRTAKLAAAAGCVVSIILMVVVVVGAPQFTVAVSLVSSVAGVAIGFAMAKTSRLRDIERALCAATDGSRKALTAPTSSTSASVSN